MKKILAVALSLAVVLAVVLFAPISPEKSINSVEALSQTDDGILSARFLNMLSRNYVYGESFYSNEDIINYSIPALLSLKSDNSDFISEIYVSSFIYNMYGVEGVDYSQINKEFLSREGMVYIIPKGYSLYEHKILSLKENEDGSYTVKTSVEVSPHDDEAYTAECTTLFVRNNASQFGFNIISSKIK